MYVDFFPVEEIVEISLSTIFMSFVCVWSSLVVCGL